MARKRKTDGEEETVQAKLKLEFPTEKEFTNLCRKVKVAEGTKNEGVSEMGGAISDAVEKKHLDKRAFGIFRRLDRLDDDKLAICLGHLYQYIAYGKLQERADRQGKLFAEGEKRDPERDPEPEQTRRPRLAASNGEPAGAA